MPTTTRKRNRDLAGELADLGYAYVGVTGGGHLAYRHPDAGRLTTSRTPSDHRDRANVLATARRQIRAASGLGGAFADFLCRHHHVKPDAEAELRLSMAAEVERWISCGAAEGIATERTGNHPNQVAAAGARIGRLELVKRGGAGAAGTSVYKVRGRDWLPEPVMPDVPEPAEPAEVVQAPAATNGHGDASALEPVSALRDVMPELERWIGAGIAADLAERDERIQVAAAMLAEQAATANALAAGLQAYAHGLEETRAILTGAASPPPPAAASTPAIGAALAEAAGHLAVAQ